MARRNKRNKDVEQVGYYEEVSDGFCESDVTQGTVLSSFCFAVEPASSEASALPTAFDISFGKASVDALMDNRQIKTEAPNPLAEYYHC